MLLKRGNSDGVHNHLRRSGMRYSYFVLFGIISLGVVGVGHPQANQANFAFKKKAFPQASVVKKIFKKAVCGFRNPRQRFVTSKDGKEVCDRTTGNIWEQNLDSMNRINRSQAEAKEFCANLNKGHNSKYELPSIQQLVSVLDYGVNDPALTPGVFDNFALNVFWSASPFVGPGDSGWALQLNRGQAFTARTNTKNFVWCVRRDQDAHADW